MITVIGEALIDLSPTADETLVRALPGGRPLGAAAGAARLGYPVALMARLSRDQFGQFLRRYAAQNGVDLSAAPDADEPATVAIAAPVTGTGDAGQRADGSHAPGLRAPGTHVAGTHAPGTHAPGTHTPGTHVAGPQVAGPHVPAGRLYYLSTADWQWSAAELAALPAASTVVYLGPLACCVPPGAGRILRRAARQQAAGALVCLDVRAHPEVMQSAARGRVLLERPLRSADVVRSSAGDIGWLYPGRAPADVARQWLTLGAGLVVITCGADGALAVRGPGSVLHRPASAARVADPAGAGDAFTAALLGRLYLLRQAGRRPGTLTGRELADMLDYAGVVAGVACERAGPDAPTAVEVRLALRARSWARDRALAR